MAKVSVVEGDITKQQVDAIVNAANTRMRGGGGVDGAIHKGAGPALLEECIARFPNGLPTGEAGWTSAYSLPAKYVIHTPGPNYRAGQKDPSLLRSSYRRSLEVADELGAKTVAFPLLSAGVFGWPLEDAAQIAAETLLQTKTSVREIRIVTFSPDLTELVNRTLQAAKP